MKRPDNDGGKGRAFDGSHDGLLEYHYGSFDVRASVEVMRKVRLEAGRQMDGLDSELLLFEKGGNWGMDQGRGGWGGGGVRASEIAACLAAREGFMRAVTASEKVFQIMKKTA